MRNIIFTIVLLLSSFLLSAQEVVVKGNFVNLQRQGTNYTLEIINTSNLITYPTKIEQDGRFHKALEKGEYLLLIEQNNLFWQKNILLNNDLDLGKIFLDTDNSLDTQLENITITTKEKILQHSKDKVIYNVQNNPLAINLNTMEAMELLPGFTIKNQELHLSGKSGIILLIDGKQTYLSQEQLNQYLQNTSASDIKSIELLRSPGTKYQASGNVAVVNIITKKPLKQTYYASFRGNYRRSEKSSQSYNASLNLNKDNFHLQAQGNLGDRRFLRQWNNDIFYPLQTWESRSKTNAKNLFYNFRIFSSMQLSSLWEVGLQYSNNSYNYKGITNENTKVIQDKNLIKTLTGPGATKQNYRQNIFSLYTTYTIDTLGSKLSVDLSQITNNSPENNSTDSYVNFPNPPYQELLMQSSSYNKNKVNSIVFKVDTDLIFGKNSLSFGGRLWHSKSTNKLNGILEDYTLENLPIKLINDNYIYKENNQSIYGSMARELTQGLYFKVGLRLEAMQTNSLLLTQQTPLKQSFFHYLPSLFFSYKDKSNNQWSISYDRSLQRPSFESLNPSRVYNTYYSYNEGNPFLTPVKTQSIAINSVISNYNATLFYNKYKNLFTQVPQINPDTNENNFIWMNYLNTQQIGLIQNYALQPLPFWHTSNELSFSYNKTQIIQKTDPDTKGWSAYASSSNSFNLNSNKTLAFSFTYTYYFKSVYQNSHESPYSNLDMNWSLKLLKNKLHITLRATDIFKSMPRNYGQSNGVPLLFFNYWDSRALSFNVIYTIDKGLKNSRSTSRVEQELNRK
ncbi:TonB-dependent receptor domain-containing protein [Myroides sp. LJL115]